VLLAVERPAGFEVDIDEPQIAAASHRLMLENGGGADAIHPQAVTVAEQIPAVPQILVKAVRWWADRRAAALPLASHAIDLVGKQADLRTPLKHRDQCPLGRGAVAIVAGCSAEEAELRNER